MRHHFLEPGLFRHWFDGWHYELAWGGSHRWFGAKFEQSSDGERGRTFSVGLWWASAYLVFERGHRPERAIGAWFDDQHLNVQLYRGNDEMNAMPWMFEWPWKRWHHMRCDVLSGDQEYPYRYELANGTVQEATATVHIEEREWRWMFKANPLRIQVRRYIDVTFSDEVGEQAGSWKGGCLGCGYDMRPGEDALGTLRRMERERRFT